MQDFAKVLEKENLTAELMGPFNDLAKDEQDSVRLLAIENCTVLAAVLPEEEKMKQLLPLVEACAMDKSWRVRNNVAQEFYEVRSRAHIAAVQQRAPLVAACPHARDGWLTFVSRVCVRVQLSKAMHVTNAHPEYPQYGRLLGLYVKLLQDPEGEVRASAAKSVHGYLTLVGQEAFLTHILPVARDLGADPMPNVRTALAESLMKVSKDSMKPEAIAQHIVPTVQSLLNCDMPEVRLKVLESFGNIAENMNGDQLQATFLTTLISLATNPQWRVRENIVNQLPLLAHKLVRARVVEGACACSFRCWCNRRPFAKR
ncbi:hypothetical protein EON66_04065 [archaeon]|nr:MAG: hypothetical protein EON66_04065 [archaeon]